MDARCTCNCYWILYVDRVIFWSSRCAVLSFTRPTWKVGRKVEPPKRLTRRQSPPLPHPRRWPTLCLWPSCWLSRALSALSVFRDWQPSLRCRRFWREPRRSSRRPPFRRRESIVPADLVTSPRSDRPRDPRRRLPAIWRRIATSLRPISSRKLYFAWWGGIGFVLREMRMTF